MVVFDVVILFICGKHKRNKEIGGPQKSVLDNQTKRKQACTRQENMKLYLQSTRKKKCYNQNLQYLQSKPTNFYNKSVRMKEQKCTWRYNELKQLFQYHSSMFKVSWGSPCIAMATQIY